MADTDPRTTQPAPVAPEAPPAEVREPKPETEAHRAGVEAVARALGQPD